MRTLPELDGEKLFITFAVIAAFLIEMFAMGIINAKFKSEHNYSLTLGGVAMAVAFASLGLGIGQIVTNKGLIWIIAIILFVIITIVVAIVDIKKLGVENGVKALLIQAILCVGSVFDVGTIIEKFQNRKASKGQKISDLKYKSDAFNTFQQTRQDYNDYVNNRYQDVDMSRYEDESQYEAVTEEDVDYEEYHYKHDFVIDKRKEEKFIKEHEVKVEENIGQDLSYLDDEEDK